PERLRRLRLIWRGLRSLYHYHPRERFFNFLEVRAKCLFGVWRPLRIEPGILHRVFSLCLHETGGRREVVKLPLGIDEYSCKLIRALRSPESLRQYEKALTGVKADPWLQNHCVAARNIRRDGSYISDYVEGLNLADVMDKVLGSEVISQSTRADVIMAIDRLVHD